MLATLPDTMVIEDHKWYLSILYIKAEDVAIFLPRDIYGNVFCLTRNILGDT
jgi:hypothetical protein